MKTCLASVLSVLFLSFSLSAADTSTLVKQLQSKDAEERRLAAKGLQEEGTDAKLAIPALTTALKDSDRIVRRMSATALGNFGEQAKSAMPALIAALKDSENSVASAATVALGKLGGDALPALRQPAKNTKVDTDMRLEAVNQIGSLQMDKSKKMIVLTEMIKSSAPSTWNPTAAAKPAETSVRLQVVKAMSAAGSEAKEVVPLLTGMLVSDEDPDVRLQIMSFVGSFGTDAKSALPTLKQIMTSTREPDMFCRDAAKETIEKIEGNKK